MYIAHVGCVSNVDDDLERRMIPRLKAGIFVRALIRRAEVAGGPAYFLCKGVVGWGAGGAAADDEKARTYFDRQIKFDPDLWIVEIEDRQGRTFVDEPVV